MDWTHVVVALLTGIVTAIPAILTFLDAVKKKGALHAFTSTIAADLVKGVLTPIAVDAEVYQAISDYAAGLPQNAASIALVRTAIAKLLNAEGTNPAVEAVLATAAELITASANPNVELGTVLLHLFKQE